MDAAKEEVPFWTGTSYLKKDGKNRITLRDPDGAVVTFGVTHSFGAPQAAVIVTDEEGDVAAVRLDRKQLAELVAWLKTELGV